MYATDWTFDLFMEDATTYKETPIKGVHCRKDASYREEFMTWFKNAARDFRETWIKEHNDRLYDRYDGYIGDAFAKTLRDMCFSDFYKETYNQRPHLPVWFYIQALNLPTSEDTLRKFCATPVDDAIRLAKRNREQF